MSRRKSPTQRQLKAGELIRRVLAEILQREHLQDPDLKGVSVTISEVRASPDLKHALVYASPLGGENIEAVIAGLNRCARFLRGHLGREMEMRSTPALKFVADMSFDQAGKMQSLMDQVNMKPDAQD